MAALRLSAISRMLTSVNLHADRCVHSKLLDLTWNHSHPMISLSKARLSSSPVHRQIVSSKAEVNGVKLHYTRVGEGNHVVLLLPGALGCAQTDFQPQLEGLCRQKYTVICMDPRGYGQSRPPDRDWPLFYLQRDAEDAATLMKTLKMPRYSVLGWSDGGITGMILAAAQQGAVRKLLIWGANAYVTPEEIELYQEIANVDNWSARMRQSFLEVYGHEYFRTHWANWTFAVTEIFKQRNGDLCIGSLPNIKCQTLIVDGVKDPLVLAEHPPFLKKHIPNSRIVSWPEGKHNLHLRYHEDFNTLAEEFLDEAE